MQSQAKQTRCSKNKNEQTLLVILLTIVLSFIFVYSALNLVQSQTQFVDDVTFVVLATGKISLINQTLGSLLLSGNTADSSNIIVVYDGNKTDELDSYIKSEFIIKNTKTPIQWIINEQIIGEIACIDLAFSKVTTNYAFLSLGDWRYQKKSFVNEAIKIMKANGKVSQIVLADLAGIWEKDISKISSIDTKLFGFNLLPSMHKLKVYRKFIGGFTKLTYNATFGKSVGVIEDFISQQYLDMGYHIHILNQSYAKQIQQTNFIYPTFETRRAYTHEMSWRIPEEEKNICRLMLNIATNLKKHVKRMVVERRVINKLIKFEQTQIKKEYQKYGFSTNIQISSQFDFAKLENSKQFKKIASVYSKTLEFESKYFKVKKIQTMDKILLSKITNIKNFEQFLAKINVSNVHSQENGLKLGAALLNSPKDKSIQEAQYFYYSDKLKIEQPIQEKKICVFLQGTRIVEKIAIGQLLQSINQQNYTNYEFVVVVDGKTDSSMSRIIGMVKYRFPHLLNRLKVIVQNEEQLGTAGNHFVRMKQFCRGSQIVLTINGNSTLLGKQVFNVVNKVFDDKENWLTFFSPIIDLNGTLSFLDMKIKQQSIRSSGVITENYLIAFRFDLGDLLPIEQVIQLQIEQESGYAKPHFIKTQSNAFHIYSYAEMSGLSRIKYFQNFPVYFYSDLPNQLAQCQNLKSIWERMKALVKFPLQQLTSLKDIPIINKNIRTSNQMVAELQNSYNKYMKCTQKVETSIIKSKFFEFLQRAMEKMKSPNYYITASEKIKFHEMPFCLVIDSFTDEGKAKLSEIIESIKKQEYSNYTVLSLIRVYGKQITQTQVKKIEQVSFINFQMPNNSYQSYKTALNKFCTRNSLIMFINSPIKPRVITQLNQLHQKHNSWMTYSITQSFVQINSFYLRLFELLETNDFDKSNRQYLHEGSQQLMSLALLQLCPKFSSHVKYEKIYESIYEKEKNGNSHILMRASKNNQQVLQRSVYDYLLSLQQDHRVDLKKLQNFLLETQNGQKYLYKPFTNSYLHKLDIFKAIEYEQIPFIPDNHYLNYREFEELDKKYNISEYIKDESRQVRFCVTIFGRNNTQFGRYWKAIQSITMQNYDNYHIVLLDDDSDDHTLQFSMQYLKQNKFPANRTTFVRNNKRNFATYNIVNSAFNFCGEDDIQVRFDADDVIVGKNALSLINTFYQRNPQLMLVHTGFKNSEYRFSLAAEYPKDQEFVNCKGSYRRYAHFITHLTTWRVKLLRSIPLKYHQTDPGSWLDTLSDDALQFCFVELATLKRIKYIPQIKYNYNTNYGWNDNSNQQKIRDRIFLMKQVIEYDTLQPLIDINDIRIQNPQIVNELQKDKKNKVFEIVNY